MDTNIECCVRDWKEDAYDRKDMSRLVEHCKRHGGDLRDMDCPNADFRMMVSAPVEFFDWLKKSRSDLAEVLYDYGTIDEGEDASELVSALLRPKYAAVSSIDGIAWAWNGGSLHMRVKHGDAHTDVKYADWKRAMRKYIKQW